MDDPFRQFLAPLWKTEGRAAYLQRETTINFWVLRARKDFKIKSQVRDKQD